MSSPPVRIVNGIHAMSNTKNEPPSQTLLTIAVPANISSRSRITRRGLWVTVNDARLVEIGAHHTIATAACPNRFGIRRSQSNTASSEMMPRTTALTSRISSVSGMFVRSETSRLEAIKSATRGAKTRARAVAICA